MARDVDASWFEPGEEVVERHTATHVRGVFSPGGKLWLTNRRLVHVPTSADRVFGARNVNLPLSQIADVARKPAFPVPQFRIEMKDGSVYAFVVGKIDQVIARIREQLPSGRICPSCGVENPADYAFCDRCGQQL